MNHLVLSAIILVFTLAAGCSRQQPVQAKQDTGPVPVRIAPVVSKEIRRTVESVGTLYPFDEAIISAEVDGRVERVNVDLGDKVVAGQVLVRINDEEQRYLVSQTEAQLRQSMERLGLKNEKDRLKDVREAPDVRRAQADLFDAEQRYQRVRKLVDQGIGSQSDLDQATARFKAAQAAYDNSLYTTRNLLQEVERYKAALELQRKKLRDTTVLAPFAGYVKERQATQGQYVRVNTPLLTLVKVDPVRLRVEIPERMAPWIRVGQVVEVTVEAFADRKFQGKIWRISPTVDQTKRTFVAEALIDNPRGELKPGSYARAKIPSDKVERTKFIPARSVNYVLGANRAYVVKGDAVEAREVKLGDRVDDMVEIIEGLEDGEMVAATGVSRLDNGTKVRVVTGDESKPGRKKAG